MTNKLFIAVIFCCLIWVNAFSQQSFYAPSWESLQSRPIPQWFKEAKFGIFIHFGLYSIPAYRPFIAGQPKNGIYSEWYAPDVMYKPHLNDSFHYRTYGKDFEYRDFAKMFKAEFYNADFWAQLFKDAGAKYVILTAKHHDAYCLWPSKEPFSKNWNSVANGPKIDFVGTLGKAVREKGMKYGLYYSLMEWESTPTTTWGNTGFYIDRAMFFKYAIPTENYITHIHDQMKELVNNYQPSILFADGAWDYPYSYWKSLEFLPWLYNNAPNKNEIVVNDRWGNNMPAQHGGYHSSEYSDNVYKVQTDHYWEECQGMGYSFGYNRAENLTDYKTSEELIHKLIRIVSGGGNFLLNVGPSGDGRIPELQQQRLMDIGKWLKAHGEAIYETSAVPFPDIYIPDELEADRFMYFTSKTDVLYLILTRWPENSTLELKEVEYTRFSTATLLSTGQKVQASIRPGGVQLTLPPFSPEIAVYGKAYVIKLTGLKF